jgi:acyl transferase domain-containing protein
MENLKHEADKPILGKQTIAAILHEICAQLLGTAEVSENKNFFEMGADSLAMSRIYRALCERIPFEFSLIDLFEYPKISDLAAFLEAKQRVQASAGDMSSAAKGAARPKASQAKAERKTAAEAPAPQAKSIRAPFGQTNKDVAIIGMGIRLPGVTTPDEFWKALTDGAELLEPLPEEQLIKQGVSDKELRNSNYVRVAGRLQDIDCFDRRYFDFTKKEAELLDPQMRVLLECSVEAIEDGCQLLDDNENDIGVFVYVGRSGYFANNILPRADIIEQVGKRRAMLYNDRSYAAGLISYKLNLSGPSMHFDAACASSLIAINQAVRSLQNNECEMALAGGVHILVPHGVGYESGEAGIESPDGHCRPFDANADGTIFTSGCGVILLKRADQALRDGDPIYGVIKGGAVTNDGAARIGFTAPSVPGQVAAIRKAQRDAGVSPSQVRYVEAHGTATSIGDPIEITALNQAFGQLPENYLCPIGSVKGNVGHLMGTSGVVGTIKAVLSMKNGQIPASINFDHPNPRIPFEKGPFYVNRALTEWSPKASDVVGVSSFGLGGMNAHIILGKAPSSASMRRHAGTSPDAALLFPLSAKTPDALRAYARKLLDKLESDEDLSLEDVSYTLGRGRAEHSARCGLAAKSNEQLQADLRKLMEGAAVANADANAVPVFLFPGQGTQHVGMMRGLYEAYEEFAKNIDYCATILINYLGLDIRTLVFPAESDEQEAVDLLKQSRYSQPILFTFEYCCAKLLQSAGIQPQAAMGHSLGEYVAACIAGVFSLEDGLKLICARGALMQSAPPGAMVATSARPENEVIVKVVEAGCCIAAVNSDYQMVFSGPYHAIDACKSILTEAAVDHVEINSLHAFHSSQMDSILEDFKAVIEGIELRAPNLPIMSNLTGEWLSEEQAQDSAYWVAHLRGTVEFHVGLRQLGQLGNVIAIEVGPEQTLARLIARGRSVLGYEAVNTCRMKKDENASDELTFSKFLMSIWQRGVPLNKEFCFPKTLGKKISLPAYAFQRERHWIDAPDQKPNEMQLGANDKHDEKAGLNAPASAAHDIGETVKALWSQLLGVSDIPDDADFFALGGDSLGLVQFQRLLASRYHTKIELDVLYRKSSLESVVGELASRQGGRPSASIAVMMQEETIRAILEDIDAIWLHVTDRAMLGNASKNASVFMNAHANQFDRINRAA